MWERFEELVAKVFEARGCDVQLRVSRPYGPVGTFRSVDVVARNAEGTVVPIETKLSVHDSVSLNELREVASRTSGLRRSAKNAKPLLVYGVRVESARREWAEDEFQIEIWDRTTLLANAGAIASELIDFFALLDGQQGSWARRQAPAAVIQADVAPDRRSDPIGTSLIESLKALPSGKRHAKTYETICRDVIDHLFGEDLKDVRSQQRTSDGLDIYDLVYRVSPKHPFWLTLTRDFRARVVLFECKNYGKSIGAMQVFTTERYLSASALRPVCFVLSRKPPHRHAIRAASSAMRETGKLLVFLSDEDLIQMLRAKDAQLRDGGSPAEMQANDPTEILDQTIYDFIAGISR